MRTTINLPDALGEAAKERARTEGRTVTSLIEEGLRVVLAESAREQEPRPLPSYGTVGDPLLVDLEDRDAVAAALDADGLR